MINFILQRQTSKKKNDKEKNHIMIPNDLWYENSCQWFLSYIWLWIFLLKKHLNFLLSMVSCCLLHRGNNWVCFKLHLRVYLRDPFPSICSRGNTKAKFSKKVFLETVYSKDSNPTSHVPACIGQLNNSRRQLLKRH